MLVWSDILPWLLSGDSLKSRQWNETLAEMTPALRLAWMMEYPSGLFTLSLLTLISGLTFG